MTDEQAVRKRALERDLLSTLQQFEKDTGLVVRGVDVLQSDVETHGGEAQHVVTDVKLQVSDINPLLT